MIVVALIAVVEVLVGAVAFALGRRAWMRIVEARARLARAERALRSACEDLKAAAECDTRAVDVRSSPDTAEFEVREIIIRRIQGRPEIVAFAPGVLVGPVRVEFWGRVREAPAFADVVLSQVAPQGAPAEA